MKTLQIQFSNGELLSINVTPSFVLPAVTEQVIVVESVEGARARINVMMVLYMVLK